MPTTIPYDPQLVLANIVSMETLSIVDQIADQQKDADIAQDKLNSLIASKRSLDMTKSELQNLGIPTADLETEIGNFGTEVKTAAAAYAKAKIAAEKNIQPLREELRKNPVQLESPVDYVKTQVKTLPLAADSINMDVQYFSMDVNKQTAETFNSNISSYISSSMSNLGSDVASKMSSAASVQINQQTTNHNISGTLVLSVSCTHKNASVLAPFALNVDKAINVWNHLFDKDEDKIVPTSSDNMNKIAQDTTKPEKGKPENKFSIISGMTFGSSFVGMVHILKTSSTTANQDMSAVVGTMQAQMDAGAWFEKMSGGFGVNSSIANDVKNLLSAQNISSHVTMICMGAIPSMVANQVQLGVEKFAAFDGKSNMDALAVLQNATIAEQASIQQSADAARTGGQLVTMKGGEIKAALSALATIDDGANKILDINSMMAALEDYLKKAAEGKSGIPINYYLKDITKPMLAEMWVAKYYPGKYLAIQNDDTKPTEPEPKTT